MTKTRTLTLNCTNIFYFLLTALAAAFFGACDENNSYQVEMLAYDATKDQMVYQVNTVETLSNLTSLEGRATRLRGGVSIVLDYRSNTVRWERVGTPVSFNSIELDGVHYPADYDSLAMISVYYNIERAMLFFESIGMSPNLTGRLDTFYWADVLELGTGQDTNKPTVDNAFYLAINEKDRGFYILPFETEGGGVITGVPLSMNPGVIIHEYSHSVFQAMIYDQLPGYGDDIPDINYNYLYGLNEGIADIFAVALTGDPDFMLPSIHDPQLTRYASKFINYDAILDTFAATMPPSRFDGAYEIGAFFSATVYEMARRFQGLPANRNAITVEEARRISIPGPVARRVCATATLSAIESLGVYGAEFFEPADFFSAFISHLGAGQQQIACEVLAERFELHFSEVIGCSR